MDSETRAPAIPPSERGHGLTPAQNRPACIGGMDALCASSGSQSEAGRRDTCQGTRGQAHGAAQIGPRLRFGELLRSWS